MAQTPKNKRLEAVKLDNYESNYIHYIQPHPSTKSASSTIKV